MRWSSLPPRCRCRTRIGRMVPTPADIEAFNAHLRRINGGTLPACPVCGPTGWTIAGIVALQVLDVPYPFGPQNPPHVVQSGQNSVVTALVNCTRCFYMMPFMWKPVALAGGGSGY